MLSHWHLVHFQLHNETIRLADLPVTGFRLKYASRAAHELRLTLETSSSVTDPSDLWSSFNRGDGYALLYDDWVSPAMPEQGSAYRTMFYGRLETTETVDTGTSRKIVLLFKGGWHYLTLAMYRSTTAPKTTLAKIGGSTLSASQWCDHILWAASLAAPGDGIQYTSQSMVDSIVSSLKLPEFTVRDATYAQVLESILAFWPDVVSYTHPRGVDDSLHVRIPSLCLAPPTTLLSVSDILSLDGYGGALVSQNIELRPNPLVPGVRVYKEDGNSAEIGSPTGLGGLMYTIDPTDASYAFYWDDFYNRYSSSLPYYIYTQNRLARPEGSIELVGDRPPGLCYLENNGCSYLLDLGIEEYSANIRSVEFDIAEGRTTINFGPSPDVDPDDLVSLLRANFFGSWKFAMNRR